MGIYCTGGGTEPLFYSNCQCSITFKNCEPRCCTPATYTILHTNYISIKKNFYIVKYYVQRVTSVFCEGISNIK